MSQLRHKFNVVLDGKQYMITTSARDISHAEIDEENPNPVNQTYRLLHAACVRLEIPDVPSDWETFADLLDDFDDLEPELGKSQVVENPTRKTV